MADEDMPDFDLLPGAGGGGSAAAAAGTSAPQAAGGGGRGGEGADDDLNEEDELEMALEAELDEEQERQQQQQGAPDLQQQQLQDAARASAAASAALQQEEGEEALPLTADGFIDLDRLTAKQHQRYNTWVASPQLCCAVPVGRRWLACTACGAPALACLVHTPQLPPCHSPAPCPCLQAGQRHLERAAAGPLLSLPPLQPAPRHAGGRTGGWPVQGRRRRRRRHYCCQCRRCWLA